MLALALDPTGLRIHNKQTNKQKLKGETMKLNKQEKSRIEKLEPLHLMRADLKAQLAYVETQIQAIEAQLQDLDPRKLLNGKAWHNGIEIYRYIRFSTSYKKCALALAEQQGHSEIPEDIKNEHTTEKQAIKTKLAGV